MAVLVTASHVLLAALRLTKDVDGWNKSGHDDVERSSPYKEEHRKFTFSA
jgi:hypothetical protein